MFGTPGNEPFFFKLQLTKAKHFVHPLSRPTDYHQRPQLQSFLMLSIPLPTQYLLGPYPKTTSFPLLSASARRQHKTVSLKSLILGNSEADLLPVHIRFRRSFELRSAPPVNPACAAPCGAYTKPAPYSLPRPPVPLAPGIDSASLRSPLALYETNVLLSPERRRTKKQNEEN
jgi:hypothetical protein